MRVLKVGLLGLGQGGWRLAQALHSSPWCRLTAVAGPRSRRVEAFVEANPGIQCYDDFRSLIVTQPLDALFVTAPPHHRLKFLPLAAERKLPVWLSAPPARRFDESVELVNLFERAGCPIVARRQWGIEPALQPDLLELDRLGRWFLARGTLTTCRAENLDWAGDSERAGGGALLHRAYLMLDTLVQAMGLPATVFARMAGVSRPGTRFPYDTEDTAALIAHYPGGAIATISVCWTSGPGRASLVLSGIGGSLCIGPRRVIGTDRKGQAVCYSHPRAAGNLQPLIEPFLRDIAGQSTRLSGVLRSHLPTMGVVEAAYLSARTGQPESPAQMFAVHNVELPRMTMER